MGVKARKALKKVVKKGSLQVAAATQNDSADFLVLCTWLYSAVCDFGAVAFVLSM